MKIHLRASCFLLLVSFPAWTQSRESYRTFLTPQVRAPKLAGPQHLRDHVHDGKLQLSLHDAVLLTLENNSAIQVQEAQVETAKFNLLHTYQPFDPILTSQDSAQRFSSFGTNFQQGSGTFSQLVHQGQFQYSQTFPTGTNVQVTLLGNRSSYSTNGIYFSFNPSWNTSLNLQFTQHLLKDHWRFQNRAPIIIARHNLQQSRAAFEAQVNYALWRAVQQYWDVMRARGTLEVDQQSLDAAQASYAHDKRALELGALPPLDIYRSEAEVASRRVQVIQAEYQLKQAEDTLRFTIGADQDNYVAALDLDLTEKPEPVGELKVIDVGTALQEATQRRPEIEAAQQALSGDDVNVRLAQNHLKPDLSLAASYQSTGVGGNQYTYIQATPTSPPIAHFSSRGGLTDAFSQLFGFGYPGYGATLTLNFPIRNRAAQADFGLALASRHRDLYSEQQVREQITLDVNNAVHRLEEAKLALAAGKTAVDLAEKMLAADQRKTELGEQNVFLLLDSQTKVAAGRANLLQAQIDYQNAVAAVDYATGNLLQSYQVQVNDLSK